MAVAEVIQETAQSSVRGVCALSDRPAPGVFEKMYRALEDSSVSQIGRMRPHLLVIPLRCDGGQVIGGLWGATFFDWLHIQMLIVPADRQGQGIGSALMQAAEAEAIRRGCRGARVDTFNFQAVPFYQNRGYRSFGELADFPPGYSQIYLAKRFGPMPPSAA